MAQGDIFGTGPNGETVIRVRLSGGGLTAHVLTWGAIIQDLRLEGHEAPLVLGFDRFDEYLHHSPFFGATPGRMSNRIAHGRFALDGRHHQLELNENGVTHLHGGRDGLASRNWDIIELEADHVVLQVVDPDGRAGFPGNCTVTARYALKAGGMLSVTYETVTDQPTIANICQHSYFSLGDGAATDDHEMMLRADSYLPTDALQIPAGGPKDVTGTPFDFRTMKSVLQTEKGEPVLYDHNFCLSAERVAKRHVGTLRSARSGVSLDVFTTEPGVQVYAGFKIDVSVPGLEGRTYGPGSGICLETQVWPDAINQEGFPNAVLRPGELLRQDTDYVFARSI